MVGNDYSAFIPLVPWLLPTNSPSELDRYQKIIYNNKKISSSIEKSDWHRLTEISGQHFTMSFSAMLCLARQLPRQDTWTAQSLPVIQHSYSQHVLTLAGHYLQDMGTERNCKKALREM